METATQESLFDLSPVQDWDKDVTKRALDELFSFAGKYKRGPAYKELIDFVSRFRMYAPYNAMLVQMQMRGARYVAPAHRWAQDYKRRIKPDARPLVILQPMGPVMFVFDVSDTEPEENAPELPSHVVSPFQIVQGRIGIEVNKTIENAVRDGVVISQKDAGSQWAGAIKRLEKTYRSQYQTKRLPKPEYVSVTVNYELNLNRDHSPETQYATLVHELAHLYCGHLGTPNARWWPNRQTLSVECCEFEAESVSYLVCKRLGIETTSAEYLSGYLKRDEDIPAISLECVMKAAGLIESMGRERLPARKDKADRIA
jgi:hypothetical protein